MDYINSQIIPSNYNCSIVPFETGTGIRFIKFLSKFSTPYPDFTLVKETYASGSSKFVQIYFEITSKSPFY